MDRANIKPSRWFAERDGHRTFDSLYQSIRLFPEEYALRRTNAGGNPISIEFPDLLKANAYNRQQSFGNTRCTSYVTALYQEWGPDYPNRDDYIGGPNLVSNFRTLPDIYLGEVPAASNYLDIRVNLGNAVAPTLILGRPYYQGLEPGQEMHLPDGSCQIEAADPLVRLFTIRRVGNSIYLSRYQSVLRGQQVDWIPGNSDANTSGWTHGYWRTGDYWSQAVDTPLNVGPQAYLGRIVHLIDVKGFDTNGTKRRINGTNSCSLGDPTNFRSVWSGDLIIRPGRKG